jgi:hypothetical protein
VKTPRAMLTASSTSAVVHSADCARSRLPPASSGDLEDHPHNGWAMFGLVQALEAQGKDATETKTMFEHTWSLADVELTASRF